MVRDTKSTVSLLSDAKKKTKDNRKLIEDQLKVIEDPATRERYLMLEVLSTQ